MKIITAKIGRAKYLFVTILCTLFFANYKYSTGIRVIAYQEEEKPVAAIASFVLMIVTASASYGVTMGAAKHPL